MDAISGDAPRRDALVERARKEAFAHRDKAKNVVPVVPSDRISAVKGVRVEVPHDLRQLRGRGLYFFQPRMQGRSAFGGLQGAFAVEAVTLLIE